MQDPNALMQTTRCLCLASRRAARTITRTFDAALREHGLRCTQFSMLCALSLKGPQTINQLADLLGNERTTISRNLAVVAQSKLVRLDVDPEDARARIARITPQGRQVLAKAFPAWHRTQDALVAQIGETAAAGLRQLAGGPCSLLDDACRASPPTEDKP